MKNIIIVVGMPGAGKEEFVRMAIQKGYSVIRMGDLVREVVAERGEEDDDKAVGRIANSEREDRGYAIWAERTAERVAEKGKRDEQAAKEQVVIDGTRSHHEVGFFREHYGQDMILVAVTAPPDIRYERIISRGRSDAARDKDQFMVRDTREMQWGIGKAIELADVQLPNDGGLEEFQKAAKDLLESL